MSAIAVKSKPHATQAAAEQWRERYYQDYHPAGYGTRLRITQTQDGYIVEGHRYDSCD